MPLNRDRVYVGIDVGGVFLYTLTRHIDMSNPHRRSEKEIWDFKQNDGEESVCHPPILSALPPSELHAGLKDEWKWRVVFDIAGDTCIAAATTYSYMRGWSPAQALTLSSFVSRRGMPQPAGLGGGTMGTKRGVVAREPVRVIPLVGL